MEIESWSNPADRSSVMARSASSRLSKTADAIRSLILISCSWGAGSHCPVECKPTAAVDVPADARHEHRSHAGGSRAASPERIRQIEAKALRKLKHPSPSREMRSSPALGNSRFPTAMLLWLIVVDGPK